MSKINISTLQNFKKLLFLRKSQKLTEIQNLRRTKKNLERLVERVNFFLFTEANLSKLRKNRLFFSSNVKSNSDRKLILVFLEDNSSNFRVEEKLFIEHTQNDKIVIFGPNSQIIDSFFKSFSERITGSEIEFTYYVVDELNKKNSNYFLDLNLNVLNHFLGLDSKIVETWILNGSSKNRVNFIQITPLYDSKLKFENTQARIKEMGGELTTFPPTRKIWSETAITSTILMTIRSHLIDSLISEKFFDVFEINQNLDVVDEQIELISREERLERNKQAIDELTILQG